VKIYTRSGDEGETDLLSGERIPKNHPIPEANGTVDELNCALGLVVSMLGPEHESLIEELHGIQSTLLAAGSLLSARPGSQRRRELRPITAETSRSLEEAIDRMTASLPELTGFILPGGHPAGALAHAARVVCRRAERRVVALGFGEDDTDEDLKGIAVYLNRLSDYCFVLARYCNLLHGVADTPGKE
jgi:cob(I)alamin adenosyltransferase